MKIYDIQVEQLQPKTNFRRIFLLKQNENKKKRKKKMQKKLHEHEHILQHVKLELHEATFRICMAERLFLCNNMRQNEQ